MSDISLSKAVRSNLLSLQITATMMGKTQERLATGNRVNSALDNPQASAGRVVRRCRRANFLRPALCR